jgi:hypothetical protein
MAKQVKESLGQFQDWQYFSLLEAKSEEAVDGKKMKEEDQKDGQEVIEKIKANLERFKSAAGDKILKYKEFWKENEEAKEKFDESGSIYKMFDSDYVVGVLTLPDKALSDEEIDAQIEEVDNEKEEEEKEEEKEEKVEDSEEDDDEDDDDDDDDKEDEEKEEIKESLNEEEGVDLDLDLGDEEKTEESPEFEQPDLGGEEEVPELGGEEEVPELEGEEEMGEETPELDDEEEGFESDEADEREFFAVFDMSGEREEIFRSDDPSLIKSFMDFYENAFKGSMKEQILKFKEAQEEKRKEAELKAEQKQREERKGKLDGFMKKA